MKTKKNDTKVGNYPIFFLERKQQKSKFENSYTDKQNIAISGTKHTVFTPKGRIIHRNYVLVNLLLILTGTATTTEEPDQEDQTADSQNPHQNRRRCTKMNRTTSRDTTAREKQPNSTEPIRQRIGEKGHVWPRQTTEVNKRPAEFKSPPKLTGRNKQHRQTRRSTVLLKMLDKQTKNFLSETITVRCLKILFHSLTPGMRTTLKTLN